MHTFMSTLSMSPYFSISFFSSHSSTCVIQCVSATQNVQTGSPMLATKALKHTSGRQTHKPQKGAGPACTHLVLKVSLRMDKWAKLAVLM